MGTIFTKNTLGTWFERPSALADAFKTSPKVTNDGFGTIRFESGIQPISFIAAGQKQLSVELSCGITSPEGYSNNPRLIITFNNVQTATQLSNRVATQILVGGIETGYTVDPVLVLNLFDGSDTRYTSILPNFSSLADGTWGKVPYLVILCKLAKDIIALGKVPDWAWVSSGGLAVTPTTTTLAVTPSLLGGDVPSPDSLLRDCSDKLDSLKAELIKFTGLEGDYDTLKRKLGELESDIQSLTDAINAKNTALIACEQSVNSRDWDKANLLSDINELQAKLASLTARNSELLNDLSNATIRGQHADDMASEIANLRILVGQAEDALQLCRDYRSTDSKKIKDLETALDLAIREKDDANTDRKALAKAFDMISKPPNITIEPMTINVPAQVEFKNPLDVRNANCNDGFFDRAKDWVKDNPGKSFGIGAAIIATVAILRR